MATPAQLDEKLAKELEGPPQHIMATPAQLDEKLAKERERPPQHNMATPAQLGEKLAKATGTNPPPLPPRSNSAQAPPAYDEDDARRSRLISNAYRSNDPRSSSTHSLVPSESGRDNHDGRRTLLLVWIHGFLGTEASFQAFPAHVHNLLTAALAETHVVHSKIYPRYKSRKDITFARDDFSAWLEPNQTHYTDTILLGHSMGGILGAEVALQPPNSPATGKAFQNRLLGTISFDTPFLGMHPGVIVSGIGSLFRPAPEPPSARQPSTSGTMSPVDSEASISSQSYAPSVVDSEFSSQLSPTQSITSPSVPSPKDPYFNPAFPNDVRLPERKGWTNLLHFVTKHSDGLTSATKQYFMSHLEFGGCLADYPGLKSRYEKIRALEDVKESGRYESGSQRPTRRIRFTNYYTASTGRPKAPKNPKVPEGHTIDEEGKVEPIGVEMRDLTLQPSATGNGNSASTEGLISTEPREGATSLQQLDEDPKRSPVEVQMHNLGENSGVQDESSEDEPEMEMRHIDSMPMEDDEELDDLPLASVETVTKADEETENTPVTSVETATEGDDETNPEVQTTTSEPALPPLPAEPIKPEPINLDAYTDKDSRKLAEKEQKRIMKVYQQAVKDRESAVKDRQRLLDKRERKLRLEQARQSRLKGKQRQKEGKEAEKQRLAEEKEEEKRRATVNPQPREEEASVTSSAKDDKPKRDKKFCMLPPEYGGKRDKCWVRVYMEGVDEVGAHCGLFFPGPQYESLVGDVGARIENWVREDLAKRAREVDE